MGIVVSVGSPAPVIILNFQPVHLEVECESHLHNVPKGTEIHFRVQIVSDQFEGLSQLQVVLPMGCFGEYSMMIKVHISAPADGEQGSGRRVGDLHSRTADRGEETVRVQRREASGCPGVWRREGDLIPSVWLSRVGRNKARALRCVDRRSEWQGLD